MEITIEDAAYFKQRAKNHAFQEMMRSFAFAAEKEGLTKEGLAARLGWDRSMKVRFFAGPSKWTLDDMCDVACQLGYEVEISFHHINPTA